MKMNIWKYDKIARLAHELHGSQVILVGGCFDLLHYGHIRFLTDAKAHGEKLVVALESDKHIHHFKKRHPIHTQEERAEMLVALNSVDHVLLLPFFSHDDEYADMVQKLQPEIVAVSTPDQHLEKKKQHASLVGAQVIEVTPVLPQFATSKIISNF